MILLKITFHITNFYVHYIKSNPYALRNYTFEHRGCLKLTNDQSTPVRSAQYPIGPSDRKRRLFTQQVPGIPRMNDVCNDEVITFVRSMPQCILNASGTFYLQSAGHLFPFILLRLIASAEKRFFTAHFIELRLGR